MLHTINKILRKNAPVAKFVGAGVSFVSGTISYLAGVDKIGGVDIKPEAPFWSGAFVALVLGFSGARDLKANNAKKYVEDTNFYELPENQHKQLVEVAYKYGMSQDLRDFISLMGTTTAKKTGEVTGPVKFFFHQKTGISL